MAISRVEDVEAPFFTPSRVQKMGITVLVFNALAAMGSLAFLLSHFHAFPWQATWLNSSLAPSVLALSITTLTVGGGIGVLLFNKSKTQRSNDTSSPTTNPLDLAYKNSVLLCEPHVREGVRCSSKLKTISNSDNALILSDIKQNSDPYRTIIYCDYTNTRYSDTSFLIDKFYQIRKELSFSPVIVYMAIFSKDIGSIIAKDHVEKVLEKANKNLGNDLRIYGLALKECSSGINVFSDSFEQFQDQIVLLAHSQRYEELQNLIQNTTSTAFI